MAEIQREKFQPGKVQRFLFKHSRNWKTVKAEIQLFREEVSFTVDGSYSQNLLPAYARKYALEFLEKNSKCEPFDAFAPDMAMTYYDQEFNSGILNGFFIFYAIHSTPVNDTINLLLLCCLSIAWKYRNNRFMLREYLNERGFKYSEKEILEMEVPIFRV